MSVPPASRTAAGIAAEASAVIGNTPLVGLRRLGEGLEGEVVAKLENFNPGGSVKDRIGVAMIDAAERDGQIEPGGGDRRADQRQHRHRPGAGLRGARLRLDPHDARGHEPRAGRLLRAYGAEVHETPSLGGMNEAVELAEQIVAERGDGFMPQQFSNPANPEIHRRTTAEEIWRDLDGEVDALRRRRRHRRHDHRRRRGAQGARARASRSSRSSRRPRRCSRAAPPGPHKIQGIGAGFVPEVLDREVIDEVIAVSDEDGARRRARRRRARGPAGRDLRGRRDRRRARGRRRGRRWPASGSS